MEINLFKYFTIKRAINVVKILTSFNISRVIRKPVIWGMPISYSIEPTNLCNLKCPECPSGLGSLTRPLGLLKMETFKNIVDQIKLTGFYVQLFFQGEPYINKELPFMIKYAQKNNIYISISTNGHFINENNVDSFIKNAPDKLIISMDGLDEETYKNYRVGGSFKKVDEGLNLLIQKKKELKSKLPFIEIQFIVMKQNEHLVDKIFEYGKVKGVDKITLKTMQISSYENALHFAPKNEKYNRYFINDKKVILKNKLKNYCFALWRTSVITWDGKVVPCCFDKDAEYELGKLNGKSMDEIWKSDKYYNFRNEILKNRKSIKMCTNCTEGMKVNIMEIES